MNAPLRRVSLAVMVMVALLLANLTYIQVIKADEYRKDGRNIRTLLEEYSRQRGQIVAGGAQLAVSEATNDRLKYQRKYPQGQMYAPITGYYSTLYGSTGLERAADDVLNGSDPRLFVPRLSDLVTGRDPRGGSVAVTIDPKIQQAAYGGLTAKGFTGAVIALKPDTGEILAMASTPSFDPNPLAAHDSDTQQKAQQADNNNGSTINRAISALYPPGSTFKLIVTAAALQNGATKDTQLPADTITLPNTTQTLTNYGGEHCPDSGATTSLENALAHSCNSAFAKLAGDIGPDKLRAQAEKFGVGQQDLQIPMNVTPSSLGALPDPASVFQSGIGQRDVRFTPLQDAMVAATIANGGIRMQPHLMKSVLTPDLTDVSDTSPEQADRAIPADVASTIKEMMLKSEDNTKGEGKIQGVQIASKTGTAEHGVNSKTTPPHGWYIAFAPAEAPKIAVAVLVENGGDEGLAAVGGSVAAPIGRAVIRAALGGG